jgi:hypothetical protein
VKADIGDHVVIIGVAGIGQILETDAQVGCIAGIGRARDHMDGVVRVDLCAAAALGREVIRPLQDGAVVGRIGIE